MPRRIKRGSVNNSTRRGEHRAAVNPYSGGSVTSDREWENHKYIDKVKTKSGKVRYIYEDGAYGSRSRSSNNGSKSRKDPTMDEYVTNTLSAIPGPLGQVLPITYASGKRVYAGLEDAVKKGQEWVRQNIKLPEEPNLFSELGNIANHTIQDGISWVQNVVQNVNNSLYLHNGYISGNGTVYYEQKSN